MFGHETTVHLVARARHEDDIRRAAERRMVREAQPKGESLGLIWKLFSRLALSDEPTRDAAIEPTIRPAS